MMEFLYFGLANFAISYTITSSKIFQGFRDVFFYRISETPIGRVMNFFYELVSCHYCFSHWIALTMILIWQPRFTNCNILVLDLLISAFSIVSISALTYGIFSYLTKEEEY